MHSFGLLPQTCRQFHMLLLSSIFVPHSCAYTSICYSHKKVPIVSPFQSLGQGCNQRGHCIASGVCSCSSGLCGSKLVLPGHPEICHLTTIKYNDMLLYSIVCNYIYIYCTYALFLFYEILRCSCHLVRVGQYLYVASPQVSVAFVVASVRLIVDVVIMVNAIAKMYLGEAEQWNLLVDEVRLFLWRWHQAIHNLSMSLKGFRMLNHWIIMEVPLF